MDMRTRLEAALGSFLLDAIRWVQRVRLGVQTRFHLDGRGRRTLWLDMGRPKRGTVVWLHGFSDRPAGFLRTALHLAQDHRVVAPALPAFHDGWVDPDETHTIPAYGTWLEPVLPGVPVIPEVTFMPGFAIARLALSMMAQARTEPPLVATTLATEIRLCST